MDETILDPIPGDNPSGENLRYLSIYGEIRERVRRARGEALPDPDDPDFHGADVERRFVIGACRDLLRRRSKDLMLAAWLTEAQLAVDGLAGLRDGLDILRGLLEKFWETLYPEIEDGDLEGRVRIIEWLDKRLAAGVDALFLADPKTDDPDGRRRRNRELDVCTDALRAVEDICREKFGDDSPGFVKLHDALRGHLSGEDKVAALLADTRAALEEHQYSEALERIGSALEYEPDQPKLRDLAERVRREKEKASEPARVTMRPDASPPVSTPPPTRAAMDDDLSPPHTQPAPPPPAAAASKGQAASVFGRIFGGIFSRRKEITPVVAIVDFTLTAPGSLAAGVPFELFVWVHQVQERADVLARAREELCSQDLLTRTKGPFRIVSGTILSVRLSIPGTVIDDPEDVIVWDGETTCASFVVALPVQSPQAKLPGVVNIYANGLRVAKISFVLSAKGVAEVSDVRYRKAFASYASDDRDAVLGRIQGIHKVAPEMEIFLDVLSLRSGQNWEQELWRVIPASDIFYLFWSSHARQSEWVEKEWRCALRERGLEFIDPIPLESPKESPPPPELSSLHFNDWELAFMRGKASA